MVHPLGRVGRSGAKVILVYLDAKSQTIPFVIKLHNRHQIIRERKAIESVQAYFPDALPGFEPHYSANRGALAYKHAGHVGGPAELSTIDVERMMNRIYEGACSTAHRAVTTRAVIPKAEYRWYLRDDAAASNIRSTLGTDARKPRMEFLGATILNPLHALRNGFNVRRSLPLGPVHGDLHPNNVVFDANWEAHLIDFAWSHRSGHVLKDFVLMENSMRFLLFPRCIDLRRQLAFDRSLLEEEFTIPTAGRSADGLGNHYNRLGRLVRTLRANARTVSGSTYDFTDYLAAQFLVLYGLLKFEEYPIHVAVRALGMMGNELATKKYL
jgi:hypothetical protein